MFVLSVSLSPLFSLFYSPPAEDEPENGGANALADTMDFIDMLDENPDETMPAYTGCFDYSVF
jgi:hypothetical protein